MSIFQDAELAAAKQQAEEEAIALVALKKRKEDMAARKRKKQKKVASRASVCPKMKPSKELGGREAFASLDLYNKNVPNVKYDGDSQTFVKLMKDGKKVEGARYKEASAISEQDRFLVGIVKGAERIYIQKRGGLFFPEGVEGNNWSDWFGGDNGNSQPISYEEMQEQGRRFGHTPNVADYTYGRRTGHPSAFPVQPPAPPAPPVTNIETPTANMTMDYPSRWDNYIQPATTTQPLSGGTGGILGSLSGLANSMIPAPSVRSGIQRGIQSGLQTARNYVQPYVQQATQTITPLVQQYRANQTTEANKATKQIGDYHQGLQNRWGKGRGLDMSNYNLMEKVRSGDAAAQQEFTGIQNDARQRQRAYDQARQNPQYHADLAAQQRPGSVGAQYFANKAKNMAGQAGTTLQPGDPNALKGTLASAPSATSAAPNGRFGNAPHFYSPGGKFNHLREPDRYDKYIS